MTIRIVQLQEPAHVPTLEVGAGHDVMKHLENDLRHRDKVARYDSFQCADPCWKVRVWPQLPPQEVNTIPLVSSNISYRIAVLEEQKRMAIKVVAEKQAPERFFKRGVITTKGDYADVMGALRTMKPGDALIVSMTPDQWKDDKGQPIEKPETKFGYTLRRYFETKGLDVTAYQSGPMEITIRKATALDKSHRGKKGK